MAGFPCVEVYQGVSASSGLAVLSQGVEMKKYRRNDLIKKFERLGLDWCAAMTGGPGRHRKGNFFVVRTLVVLGQQGNLFLAQYRCVRSGGRDSLWVRVV